MKPTNSPEIRARLEEDATAVLERARWPDGPQCPNCGEISRVRSVKSGRPGLYRCYCSTYFTLTSGTFMKGTHLPRWVWLHAIEMTIGGATARAIKRDCRISYTSACRLRVEIRKAKKSGELSYYGKRWRILTEEQIKVLKSKAK